MAIPFEIDSYPYEFIHTDDDNITFEITFKKELNPDPLLHFTDYEIMRNTFYGWHNRYVTFTAETIRDVVSKEYHDKITLAVHEKFGKTNPVFWGVYALAMYTRYPVPSRMLKISSFRKRHRNILYNISGSSRRLVPTWDKASSKQ